MYSIFTFFYVIIPARCNR